MDLLEKEKTEGLEFIRIIIRQFRLILIFTASVTIITLIVTLFIPKKYTSSAIVFPTETNSLDDVIRNPQFGYDIEADRLTQLLESRSVRDSICKKFDLLRYYEIDTIDPQWQDLLRKKYNRDIRYSKTMFMSVVISAETKDPILSANIVNTIVRLVNRERENLLKQNLDPTIAAYQDEYNILREDLDSLSDVVDRMTGSRKGVKQYIQADRNISLILDRDMLGNGYEAKAIQAVVNVYNIKLSWFYDVQTRLKNATLMKARPLPSVYIVETAIPSYKKSSPHIMVNMMIACAGSFIFITFGLFLYYRILKIRNLLNEK